MRRRESLINTSTMSFLDIVCAGFGSAIFMFIVFASQPISPAGGMLGSTEYLDIEMTWDDPNLRLELILTLPTKDEVAIGQNMPGETSNFSLDPLFGQLLVEPSRSATFGNGWGLAYLSGSSPHRESILEVGARQTLRLRLLDPCPGEWKVAINQNNSLGGLGEEVEPETVRIKAFTANSDGYFFSEVQFDSNELWGDVIRGVRTNPYKNFVWTKMQGGVPAAETREIEIDTPSIPTPQAHCS